MERHTPLVIGETYHIFNRGAHKQAIFLDESDLRRFQILLFIANSPRPVDIKNTLRKYEGPTFVNLYENEQSSARLVDVLAYTLMPNHFHLVLRERNEKGITEFIRKVCTGYSMYFNLRHDHSGTLFQGKFRSNHIDNDPYFKWIFAYVHLNPIALVDPNWEEKDIKDTNKALTTLNNYRYSSFYDFYTAERPERNILAYNETLHYIDRAQEIGALVRGYRRGSSLYPTFTPNRA